MAKEGSGRKEEKIVNITRVEGKKGGWNWPESKINKKGGTSKERRKGSKREGR